MKTKNKGWETPAKLFYFFFKPLKAPPFIASSPASVLAFPPPNTDANLGVCTVPCAVSLVPNDCGFLMSVNTLVISFPLTNAEAAVVVGTTVAASKFSPY